MGKTFEINALIRAQQICARQEKCKADIRKKLYEWKIARNEHDEIIQKLINERYIDDERYAGFFVRDKFRFNKWGKIKIEFELKAKEISNDIIQQVLQTIEQQEYEDVCRQLISQKLKSLGNEEPAKTKEKLLRFVQSRGFEADLVYKLVQNVIQLQKQKNNHAEN